MFYIVVNILLQLKLLVSNKIFLKTAIMLRKDKEIKQRITKVNKAKTKNNNSIYQKKV